MANARKATALLLVGMLAAASAQATVAKTQTLGQMEASIAVAKVPAKDLVAANGAGCGFCVQAMGQIINQLLNYILNVGVVGSCAALCGQLPAKLEQTACNLLCDVVGIEGFVKAIQKADLDPIYYCQIVDVCEAKDCPSSNPDCVSVDKVELSPTSGGLDAQFTATASYTVTDEVGAGEMQFAIAPTDGSAEPIGTGSMFPNLEKGTFSGQLQFQPSDINKQAEQQQQPDFFVAGKEYEVIFVICEGQCGSSHPHSKLFGMMRSNFNITNQENVVTARKLRFTL